MIYIQSVSSLNMIATVRTVVISGAGLSSRCRQCVLGDDLRWNRPSPVVAMVSVLQDVGKPYQPVSPRFSVKARQLCLCNKSDIFAV